jgi:acetyl-CoA carboxylase carboxyltransferase component
LRDAIPLGRNAVFDPRTIITTLADRDSVIELRALYGLGVVTVLARLGGHPVAIAATNPRHLAGALDVAGCDKLSRFMQLADAAGHPLITLVDTPGFMVGPASEAQGMLRHAGRVFVTAAALRVPMVSVVLRRGFGLGAMAFTGGHFHAPVATAAWPQAEFNIEGNPYHNLMPFIEAVRPQQCTFVPDSAGVNVSALNTDRTTENAMVSENC